MSQSPRKNEKREQQEHVDALLRDAIEQWRPEQPRRWLARFGGWSFEGRNPLVLEYRAIRRKAKTLTSKR
ncbi:TPA: hypothetical protein ACSP15_003558 [Aeromonas veronii]